MRADHEASYDMGLDIAVGILALAQQEGADEEELSIYEEQFQELNVVLAQAGLQRHREPKAVAETFEAQMYGYSGLHTVRRLAAWIEIEGRLPPEPGQNVDASKDQMVEQLNARLLQYEQSSKTGGARQGWLSGLFRQAKTRPPKPGFQHLLWHSDAEGFYVPQRFDDDVVFDLTGQYPGLGGMVGSSHALYDDCLRLAQRIELPLDLDPESDELYELTQSPSTDGPPWKQFAVESFCLSRLVRASKLSMETGAAIIFR